MKLLSKLGSKSEGFSISSGTVEVSPMTAMNPLMLYETATQEFKKLNLLPNIPALQSLNLNDNDVRIIITECQTKAILASTIGRIIISLRPQDYTVEEKQKISLAVLQIGNIYMELAQKIKATYPKIDDFAIESAHSIPSDRTQVNMYLSHIAHELKNRNNDFAILFATAGIDAAKAINAIEDAIKIIGTASTNSAVEGMTRELSLIDQGADIAYKKVMDRLENLERRTAVTKSYTDLKNELANAKHVTLVQGDQINHYGTGTGPGPSNEGSGLWKWIASTPLWVGAGIVVAAGLVIYYVDVIGVLGAVAEKLFNFWTRLTIEIFKSSATGAGTAVADYTGLTYAYNTMSGALSHVQGGLNYVRSGLTAIGGVIGVEMLRGWLHKPTSVSI